MFDHQRHGGAAVAPASGAAGRFAYFFGDAPAFPNRPGVVQHLDALADAMTEASDTPEPDATVPAVFTYLGQFIDHDITAGTDSDAGLSVIDRPDFEPAARHAVVADRLNRRAATLNLDVLYGGTNDDGPFSTPLRDLLRAPFDRAKMWLGTAIDAGFGGVDLPADIGKDLLRLDRLVSGQHPVIPPEEILALPEPIRAAFVEPDGSLRLRRAIIGDPRNDENLAVAQLHLAFLRFHNRIVDTATSGSADQRYARAQTLTRWHYQWLVLNDYLRRLCDPAVLFDVLSDDAPLYRRLVSQNPPEHPSMPPMPLEFSVAAFRFGHSMVRATYDWNRHFGRPVPGTTPLLPRAGFDLLFDFTGGGRMPTPSGASLPRLPEHWVIEWSRFAQDPPEHADQAARPIDTRLAEPLDDMINVEPGLANVMRRLARRNLRRGYKLNLPSAQACITAMGSVTGRPITPLDRDVLCSGPTGAAVRAGGFDTDTPLWFYVLKEAEVLGKGVRLGPLGSRIIAETLVGLIVCDPSSYWWQRGANGGRWRPADGARPEGEVVDSIPALLRAAKFL